MGRASCTIEKPHALIYNSDMFILFAVVVIGFFLFMLFRRDSSESDYSRTRNWADFDPGKDSDKVGDPSYPTAGHDSVMKQEFLDELMDGEKK